MFLVRPILMGPTVRWRSGSDNCAADDKSATDEVFGNSICQLWHLALASLTYILVYKARWSSLSQFDSCVHSSLCSCTGPDSAGSTYHGSNQLSAFLGLGSRLAAAPRLLVSIRSSS